MDTDTIRESAPAADAFIELKRDSLLEMLIALVDGLKIKENKELPIDVTLALSGMLVSGRVIPFVDYVDHFTVGFPDAVIEQFRKDAREAYVENEPRRNFIHLKNARFYTPGQVPIPGLGYDGLIWRCRLSEIAGYSMGQLKQVD